MGRGNWNNVYILSDRMCTYMIKRADVIIYGRVQKAGFRDFIDEIAFNLNLNGYVKNLKDGTVQVICEGEESSIKKLLEKINIKQYPIRVEKIDIGYSKPTGEFTTFEVIREEDLTTATYERMDTAARYMREMNSNLGQKIDGLGEQLGSKIDGLGDKIDGVGDKIDGLGDKIDGLGDKIDQSRIEMASGIHSLRYDLKSLLDERLSRMESELAEIKAKMASIQHASDSSHDSKTEITQVE
jgi:acylphosphatase